MRFSEEYVNYWVAHYFRVVWLGICLFISDCICVSAYARGFIRPMVLARMLSSWSICSWFLLVCCVCFSAFGACAVFAVGRFNINMSRFSEFPLVRFPHFPFFVSGVLVWGFSCSPLRALWFKVGSFLLRFVASFGFSILGWYVVMSCSCLGSGEALSSREYLLSDFFFATRSLFCGQRHRGHFVCIFVVLDVVGASGGRRRFLGGMDIALCFFRVSICLGVVLVCLVVLSIALCTPMLPAMHHFQVVRSFMLMGFGALFLARW